ncbi:MAG: hypothetical protein IT306_25620 [Chloroflexi bacterium]|nr:hypothetical protein [Chloroflexota bacterium]
MAERYSDWPAGTQLPVVGARFTPEEDPLPGQSAFYVGRLGQFVAVRHETVSVDGESKLRLWYEDA